MALQLVQGLVSCAALGNAAAFTATRAALLGRHDLALQAQGQVAQGRQCLNGLAACTGHIGLRLTQVEHGHIQRVMRIGVQLDGVGLAGAAQRLAC